VLRHGSMNDLFRRMVVQFGYEDRPEEFAADLAEIVASVPAAVPLAQLAETASPVTAKAAKSK